MVEDNDHLVFRYILQIAFHPGQDIVGDASLIVLGRVVKDIVKADKVDVAPIE